MPPRRRKRRRRPMRRRRPTIRSRPIPPSRPRPTRDPPMAFFSKTIDKLKGALKKTWTVLNTDIGTLFIPGRQIDERFLVDMEERFIQADMGVRNVERIVAAVRDRWRLGKIKNAAQAKDVVKDELMAILGGPANRELNFAASGVTAILV